MGHGSRFKNCSFYLKIDNATFRIFSTLWANVIILFTAVIYERLQKAKVFVLAGLSSLAQSLGVRLELTRVKQLSGTSL
jgi:hypothetical protein